MESQENDADFVEEKKIRIVHFFYTNVNETKGTRVK